MANNLQKFIVASTLALGMAHSAYAWKNAAGEECDANGNPIKTQPAKSGSKSSSKSNSSSNSTSDSSSKSSSDSKSDSTSTSSSDSNNSSSTNSGNNSSGSGVTYNGGLGGLSLSPIALPATLSGATTQVVPCSAEISVSKGHKGFNIVAISFAKTGDITTQVATGGASAPLLDKDGKPVYVADKNGNPLLDKDGKPVVATILDTSECAKTAQDAQLQAIAKTAKAQVASSAVTAAGTNPAVCDMAGLALAATFKDDVSGFGSTKEAYDTITKKCAPVVVEKIVEKPVIVYREKKAPVTPATPTKPKPCVLRSVKICEAQ